MSKPIKKGLITSEVYATYKEGTKKGLLPKDIANSMGVAYGTLHYHICKHEGRLPASKRSSGYRSKITIAKPKKVTKRAPVMINIPVEEPTPTTTDNIVAFFGSPATVATTIREMINESRDN